MTKRSNKKKPVRANMSVQTLPNASIQSKTSPSVGIDSTKNFLLQALVIVVAGLWIYWPALRGTWIWDDTLLVENNVDLRSFDGFLRIWLAPPATDYWPLTWTLLWTEWHLWGNSTLGYHLVSLSLHLWSAFLIWRIFHKLGLRFGWLGGLLFVVHPLSVESVAWISEVKNTLSTPLFLLALAAYIDFDKDREKTAYLRSVFFFLLAMLSKTSVIMLPVVLLVYCWWKHNRVTWRTFRELIPFWAIAFGLGLLGIYFQNLHALDDPVVDSRGVSARFIQAGTVICFYLGKFLLPITLLPLYPRQLLSPISLAQLSTLPVFAILLFVLWKMRKIGARHFLFGFAFFVLLLLPVLGFVKISYFNLSWVADHLTYLPMIGLIGLAILCLEAANDRIRSSSLRLFYGVSLALIFGSLAFNSRCYAKMFASDFTLWNYLVSETPNSDIAHDDLGLAWMNTYGNFTKALEQYQIALQLNPNFGLAHEHIGCALLDKNDESLVPEAIKQFQAAILLQPKNADAYVDLGCAMDKTKNGLAEAISDYKTAIQLKPSFAEAHMNLAYALLESPTGKAEAIKELTLAVRCNPYLTGAQSKLAVLLAAEPGHEEDAAMHFEAAVRSDPTDADDEYNLAFIMAHIPTHIPDSINHFRAYLKLRPDDALAHYNFGAVLLLAPGHRSEAVDQLKLALHFRPDFKAAQQLLSRLGNEDLK